MALESAVRDRHLIAMRALLLAFLVLAVAGHNLASAGSEIDRFFGDYVGRSIEAAGEPLAPRDLSVSIRPHGSGFTLAWTTVIHRSAATPKRESYSIDFSPAARDGLYASDMRRDVFGNQMPLDPLKGDPYVWARIKGPTLTVFTLIITDDGDYEIQRYDRTLVPGGMTLRFADDRGGHEEKVVTGTLARRSGG